MTTFPQKHMPRWSNTVHIISQDGSWFRLKVPQIFCDDASPFSGLLWRPVENRRRQPLLDCWQSWIWLWISEVFLVARCRRLWRSQWENSSQMVSTLRLFTMHLLLFRRLLGNNDATSHDVTSSHDYVTLDLLHCEIPPLVLLISLRCVNI